MVVMIIPIKKLNPKEYSVTQLHMQADNITTNLKVKIDFTLPKSSATKIVMCKCYVDESCKRRYDMILGRYLLTSLGLNLNLSEHVIKSDGGLLKFSSAPMVDFGMNGFKDLNIGIFYPKIFYECLRRRNI